MRWKTGRRSTNIEDRRRVVYVVLAPENKSCRVITSIYTTRAAAELHMATMTTAWLEEHPLCS